MVKEVKTSTLNCSEVLRVVARFVRGINERGLGKYFEDEFVRDGWGDLSPFLVPWIKLIPRLRESIRTSELLPDKQARLSRRTVFEITPIRNFSPRRRNRVILRRLPALDGYRAKSIFWDS